MIAFHMFNIFTEHQEGWLAFTIVVAIVLTIIGLWEALQ